MTALRQRKGSKGKEPPLGAESQTQQTNCCPDHRPETALHGGWSWGAIIWTSVGWSVSVGLGLLCCIYMATLHENDLWFSNIKEVEREISFRTECGLYYSYYKQMLQAPSIQEGLSDLIHDNLTESKRTINLLQRMNIYQEVFLSVLYRLLPMQSYLEPVYFYIYTVFSLQAVYVIALYLTAWLLSGSWLAGALTGVWYIVNRGPRSTHGGSRSTHGGPRSTHGAHGACMGPTEHAWGPTEHAWGPRSMHGAHGARMGTHGARMGTHGASARMFPLAPPSSPRSSLVLNCELAY